MPSSRNSQRQPASPPAPCSQIREQLSCVSSTPFIQRGEVDQPGAQLGKAEATPLSSCSSNAGGGSWSPHMHGGTTWRR